MCGRFGIEVGYDEAANEFQARPIYQFRPSYNVSPGQTIPAVVRNDDEQVIDGFTWGMIPFRDKEGRGRLMINARAETVDQKPAFSKSFKTQRCIIIATGFYEWKKAGTAKQPYYIRPKDRRLFGFAGIWGTSERDGTRERNCTIITTEPNSAVEHIHDRMPVILSKQAESIWLDPDRSVPELKALLKPYPANQTDSYEVSKAVNAPTNDGPDLIRPIAPSRGLDSFLK